MITYVILGLLVGNELSVFLAGSFLFLRENYLQTVATWLVSLAGGTMLGAALLAMLPRALHLAPSSDVMMGVLGGLLFFFLLEKLILWRTCNSKDCERHKNASGPLILIGGAFHNAIDGVVIASAFLTSFDLGIMVTFTVFAHEIPHKLGDFGVLIKNGFSRRAALWYNVLIGFTSLIFGTTAYFAMQSVMQLLPWILAFSAASFLYVSLADLVPQMHQKTRPKDSLVQLLLILTGIFIIYLVVHAG
jgi:zinc and cadmium transporter